MFHRVYDSERCVGVHSFTNPFACVTAVLIDQVRVLPVLPLQPGAPGTERLSPELDEKLKGLILTRLNPNYWPTSFFDLGSRLSGHERDPVVLVFPANSGSLTFSRATQKRKLFKFEEGLGITKAGYKRLEQLWNQRKLHGRLRSGGVAVATDDVVEESVGMDAGEYTILAKEMCLRMENNERLGGRKGLSLIHI